MATSSHTQSIQAVISSLLHHVWFLSLSQVAATFYSHASNPIGAAEQALKRSVQDGWVARANVNVQILPPTAGPLFQWREQGDPAPNYSALASQSQARLRNIPLRTVTVWFAKEMAAKQFGGAGGAWIFNCPQNLTHEYNLNGVVCNLMRREPEVAATFIPERDLTQRFLIDVRAGVRLPDGIVFREGKPEAIEFAGRARASRIAKLHEFCVRQRPPLPYTLY